MDIKIVRPFSGSYPVTFKFGEDPDWYHKAFFEAHNGIDYGMPVGTPLLACDKGTLLFADHLPDLDGRGIILNHSWGQSYYWHTSEELAKYGTEIEKGDPIGYSGATGFATGPHLHFGIRVNNPDSLNIRGFIDPEPYFEDMVTTPQPPSPINKTHIVLPGDTLFGIAKKFYGNGSQWRRIWDANTDKIKNPNLIYPLQILKIP